VSPSNPKSPGPRPISIPSGILIHPAIWPQQTWAENWGRGCSVPLGRGSYHNVSSAEAYVHAKFHLDPSNRLATIQADQTDRTDRQRTDSIGRTVLQTVAQKLKPGSVASHDISGNGEGHSCFGAS